MNDLTFLEKEKLIKSTSVTAAKLISIKIHFDNKIKAAKISCGVNQYLYYYDALFRLLDYALVKNSYELTNNTPHVAFKKGLQILFPDIIDDIILSEIIKERHKAKKNNLLPKESYLIELCKIIDKIQQRLELK